MAWFSPGTLPEASYTARWLLLLTGTAATTAQAHSFGQVYNLPVPVWLYQYGAVAALGLSFLVIAWFSSSAREPGRAWVYDLTGSGFHRGLRKTRAGWLLRASGLFFLLLCIATGWFGVPDLYANFNMTFFWILFVLGLAYCCAVVGNLYAVANPWRTLCRGLNRILPGYFRGRFAYPQRLGYLPALGFYLLFIWIELFGATRPDTLAGWLAGYTLVNVAGVALIGGRDWFRYCEFFGVVFRLFASMAPLQYGLPDNAQPPRSRLQLRPPFAGLLDGAAAPLSLLLFILFMLAATAFDGLHETVAWHRLYWVDLYRSYLQHWYGANPFAAFPQMRALYPWWQLFWLLASGFIYLGVYWLFMAAAKAMGRSRLPVSEVALRFTWSLLPIVLVYHVTHYYTLIQTQGVKIIALISDPFGFGWNLFGTADWLQRSIVPDAVVVWHVQVGLIVLGHVVSVYIAHVQALRTFSTPRLALFSQLPILALMMGFTASGLWILAQPLNP